MPDKDSAGKEDAHLGIKVIGYSEFIVGILIVLSPLVLVFNALISGPFGEAWAAVYLSFIVLFIPLLFWLSWGMLFIFMGIGMLQRKRWSLIATRTASLLGLMFVLIGGTSLAILAFERLSHGLGIIAWVVLIGVIIFLGWVIWYSFRGKVSELFK